MRIETLTFEKNWSVNCVEITNENESFQIVFYSGIYVLTDGNLLFLTGRITRNPRQHFMS